jgi:hypothetical protein
MSSRVLSSLKSTGHTESKVQNLVPVLCFATGAILCVILFGEALIQLGRPWAAQRLSGPIAWHYGIPLYDGSEGPRTGWAYLPLGALFLSAMGFLGHPMVAMFCASLVSLIATLSPVVLYFFYFPSREKPLRALYVMIFIVLSLNSSAIRYSMSAVHVDGLAIGFCATSAVLLALALRQIIPRTLSIDFAIVVFALASFWTKQNMVPVPFAILIASWWCSGWKGTRRLALVMIVATVLSLVLVALFFDVHNLVLNCFTELSRFPWKKGLSTEAIDVLPSIGDKIHTLTASFLNLYKEILPLVAGSAFYYRKMLGKDSRISFSVFGIIALMLLPVSIMDSVKGGGLSNGHSPFVYFLIFLFVAGLSEVSDKTESENKNFRFGFSELLLFALAPLIAMILSDQYNQLSQLHLLEQTAFEYAAKHPGKTFFYENPTAQLMAEHKMYLTGYSVNDREWARMPVSSKWVRSLVPDSVSEIIVPEGMVNRTILSSFPEFKPVGRVLDLPGFEVFRRSGKI